METSIKKFNNIPVRDRPKTQLKYTDVVSYVVFASFLPLICLHAMVISPLLGFNLLLSYVKFDTVSEHLESIIRYFSSVRIYHVHIAQWDIFCGIDLRN